MSEIMPRDILSELWEEILKIQYNYMDAEESLQKLEQRKKLEGNLKELLCRVRHDRKFFLPETALVLKNSICQHKEFSINKAITAFESISQYANNLYSKPWRKEFRILKMYSGFYQHEIKSSLIDAEKLFVAMGYRRLSEDTLILDGPICPDQVSNVFRDAMSAYVELQIMKNILMGLEANDITANWLDIFCYREKHVGGTTQAVKDLMFAVQEKRCRTNEKPLPVDNYGFIDVQSSPYFSTPSPQQCQCNNIYNHPPVPRQRAAATNGPCCMHEIPPHSNHSNMMFANYPTHNYHHQHQQQVNMGSDTLTQLPPHMSHSRSLEHYSEPNHTMLPHRHSFDHQQQGCTAAIHHPHHMPPQHRSHHIAAQQQQQQQQQQYYRNAPQNYYDPTYDCIDENSVGGGSVISYAAVAAAMGGGPGPAGRNSGSGLDVSCNSGLNYNVNASTYANPYNAPGNRFPLPYNISNQLSAYELSNSHHIGGVEPTYARVMDNHMYSQVTKTPQNYLANLDNTANGANPYNFGKTGENYNNDSVHRQNSYVPEHLIQFEDSTIIPPPPSAQFDSYHHQQYTSSTPQDNGRGKHYGKISSVADHQNVSGSNGETMSMSKTNINNDMYVYAKPIPKECRQMQKNMQGSMDNKATTTCLRKSSYTSGERGAGAGDTTDMSYESITDDLRQRQQSPTQFSKNQDGVGSFESWNYVFKNLERSGYSKDLGEREDLLVKTLGLESLNIANDSTTPSQSSSIVEKRKSGYKENENPLQVKSKTRIFNASAPAGGNSNNTQKQKPQTDNNKQVVKSALKQPSRGGTTGATKKTNPSGNKKTANVVKPNDNKPKGNSSSFSDNNNVRGAATNGKSNKKSTTQNSVLSKSSSSTAEAPQPVSTQIIVTGANEWSCQFCTLINADTTKICQACFHTKDFDVNALPSTSSNTTTTTTATPQSAVTHNTPTCV